MAYPPVSSVIFIFARCSISDLQSVYLLDGMLDLLRELSGFSQTVLGLLLGENGQSRFDALLSLDEGGSSRQTL